VAVFKDSLLGFSLATCISLGGELSIREGDALSKPTGDTEGDVLVNTTGGTEGTGLGAGVGFSVGLFVELIAFDSVAGDVVGGAVLPPIGAGTLMGVVRQCALPGDDLLERHHVRIARMCLQFRVAVECPPIQTGLLTYDVLLHYVYERYTAVDGDHAHHVILAGFDFEAP
jgi:hypothetical protein